MGKGRRRKYFFKKDFKNMTPDEQYVYLHREVFEITEFKNHVERVSNNLKIDKVIVKDVLVSYWTNVFKIINTVRRVKTKINIYGFFSLVVRKGRRV